MRATAATNRVTQAERSHAVQYAGSAVNPVIPVGGVEAWRLEAIKKVCALGNLDNNWDGHNSGAPSRGVRNCAVDLLLSVPGVNWPTPRVVPVSGGGLHFEWSLGRRELELYIEPDCSIELLRVENGMPIEAEPPEDVSSFFEWLSAR